MVILGLLTDAFGASGGIAAYNRALLGTLLEQPEVSELRILLRHFSPTPDELPHRKLSIQTEASKGKLAFVFSCLKQCFSEKPQLVICGHIHLLPLAVLVAFFQRCPILLLCFGIEVWTPKLPRIYRVFLRRVDSLICVSEFTKQKMLEWTPLPSLVSVIHPCIDTEVYTPGPRPEYLLRELDLASSPVLLTLARFDSQERYKGVDEVLESLPSLLEEFPGLSYLLVGRGDDVPRLEEKVKSLGLEKHVHFIGWVDEAHKVDYYRLADLFVMPGRGEGFGIVYLEAIACGLPVVCSTLDGSQEVLQNPSHGKAVNPNKPIELQDAIRTLLHSDTSKKPWSLAEFSQAGFAERLRAHIARLSLS